MVAWVSDRWSYIQGRVALGGGRLETRLPLELGLIGMDAKVRFVKITTAALMERACQ